MQVTMERTSSPIEAFRAHELRLPSLKAEGSAFIKARWMNHIPSNARNGKLRVICNAPGVNALGSAAHQSAVKGTVVDEDADWLLVKTGRTEFAAVYKVLLREPVPVGAKVTITPYRPRTFDGRALGEPMQVEDGGNFTVTRILIGESVSPLPVPQPQCQELKDLIYQIEHYPAGDYEDLRKVSHILVDANATDFSLVDPTDEMICDTPPAIRCAVRTKKFDGRIEISYQRGPDYFQLMGIPSNATAPTVVEHIAFNELGARLIDLIDDGEWRYAKVVIEGMVKSRRS